MMEPFFRWYIFYFLSIYFIIIVNIVEDMYTNGFAVTTIITTIIYFIYLINNTVLYLN